jgi:hypothetical protein
MATPNTFTQKNVFLAYPPNFAAVRGVDALDSTLLTARMPLRRDAKPLPTRRVTRRDQPDCTGKYLVARRLTSRLTLYSFELPYVSAQLAAGFLALALSEAAAPTGGGPHTSLITRSASDDLYGITFAVGAEDSDEPVELYKAMKLDGLDIEANVREALKLRVSFVGSGEVEILDPFDVPTCDSAPVALYPEDCLLTIGGTDYTDNLRSLAYRFNNNIASNDDPFVWDSVDAGRIERGDETSLFQLSVYGTKAHPLYAHALAEDVLALSLRIGSATEGTTIATPGAQLTLQDTPVGYAGEKSRSVVNLDATPFSVTGALPDHVTYVGAQTERFLAVPA